MSECAELFIPFGIMFGILLLGIFLMLSQIRDVLTRKGTL
jgi:hypothetical protein